MSTATATDPTAQFADEVVTDAKVRYVDLPGVESPIALITLDNGFDHTKPNTFGPGGLLKLDAALDAIEAHTPTVAAIAVTGKPFIFAVGADLTGVPNVTSREVALEIGQLGHRVFNRIKESSVPTFAFVNGAAMGGGVEIALHCDYRTLSSGIPALALPECFLGLVPGWGGTQLLPNLIGAEKAVTVIIENPLNQNRMLKGKQAFDLGIGDALFEPADFLEQSLLWAAQVLRGEVTVQRPEVERGDAWAAAVARGRGIADGKTHGYAPAPYRALDLIEQAETVSFALGTAGEDEALADLMMSDELRAGLYSFDLVQKRAKRPAGAPDKSLARKVTKVGIVGAGLMASQLALLFARQLEVPVVLNDIDQGRIDKGVDWVHGEVDKLLAKKRVSADKANRLKALVTGSLTKDAFRDADFVLEAVFEEMGVKQKVFAEVEEFVSPTAILATNTSSLSVSEMASALQHPERVVGFHFFNPVAVLPLLEIIRADKTDDATLATAFATGKALKKSSVLAKDAPAFVFNRLITRALGEVTAAVDEGTDYETADRAVEPLGMPMSPMLLLQLVGPAIALHTAETLHRAFPERYGVSEGLGALVKAGKTGVYSFGADGMTVDPELVHLRVHGHAVYSFGADGMTVDPEVDKLWERGSNALPADQVLERAASAIAEEIRLMLDEGVVAQAEDIDLCLLLGGGWAFWNGGITPYLDRTGISEKVNGQRFHAAGVASLPA